MDKYKPMIDDWQAFKQQSEKYPRQGLRRNPLKAGNDFEERLSESFELEKSPWNSNIYRVSSETPGKSMLHWRGEYYVQEESAALPVEVLNPQPGEKVLDMCAAPGGKTTQIAAKMKNRGLVVANDSSGQRMKSLHANVYRTGSKIVEAVNYDGRNLQEDEMFDRILVDAPCSGEGDRFYRNFEAADEESEGLSRLQKNLMEKASRLVRDGGRIVYSTCTIAPEENEGVVSEVLESTDLELQDISVSFDHQQGLDSFQREEFGDMSATIRVLPHHLNSGIIFVASFGKSEGGSNKEKNSGFRSSGDSRNKAKEYVKERFGIENVNLEKVNGDYWLCSPKTSGLDKETRGIRAVRDMKIGLKPTTYFLQLMQDQISKNIVKVSEADLRTFREDGMIQRELDKKGYAALKFRERIIGCGFYKDGLVSNRIPEGRLEELMETFH